MTIIEQKEQLLYPEVVFNRPINRLQMPLITVLGGRTGHLATISQLYATIEAMGNRQRLIVPSDVAASVQLPADLTLIMADPGHHQHGNVADVIQALDDSNLLVAGLDMALTSQLQIAVEKILAHSSRDVLMTAELFPVLLLNSRVAPRYIFGSTGELLKLANGLKVPLSIKPDRGIFNHIDMLRALQQRLGGAVILFTAEQLILLDVDSDEVGLVQFDATSAKLHDRGALLGVLAAFLAAPAHNNARFLPQTLTAGYLYRRALRETTEKKNLPNKLGQILQNMV